MKPSKLLTIIVLMMLPFAANAQTTLLADFENGTTGRLRIGTDYDSNLFSAVPRVRTNPSKTGINTSNRCITVTNVADAGWWRNFLILELKQPVTITDDNRILSFLAYRSIQPKDMRIGINTYEESGQLFQGKLSADGEWERITLDLQYDPSQKDAASLKLPSRSVVTVVMSGIDPDAIADIKARTNGDDKVWLLNGLQAKQPLKGIYIKNGQKHISK